MYTEYYAENAYINIFNISFSLQLFLHLDK